MNIKNINSLYDSIMDLSCGVEKVKVDLHIHTPASNDFVYKPLTKDDAFIHILDEALYNNIRIIAITDHNTFAGYNYIKKILNNPTFSQKYSNLLILCGIEITCFSKHLIAIFPECFGEEQQKSFLKEIGIDSTVEGSEDALADIFGPALLIDKISTYGGFSILAHADSNSGFLQDLCGNKTLSGEISINGKSLAKIIQRPSLLAIQCNSDVNQEKLTRKFNNKEYLRPNNPLAYIKCSDCHGINMDVYKGTSGQAIGSFYSEIKLSEFSFESLKMAFLDSEMRVCKQTNNFDYAYIEGIAINSPIFSDKGDYSFFRFSPELNCIIGSRGTGKTTVLEIMQSIIMPNTLKRDNCKNVYKKYNSAVVFIKIKDLIYAISSETKQKKDGYVQEVYDYDELKVYVRKVNAKSFTTKTIDYGTSLLEILLTAGYQQRQLYDYSVNPDKILEIVDDFLNWKNRIEYQKIIKQIEFQQNSLQEKLKEIKDKRSVLGKTFYDYIYENNEIKNIISTLTLINKRKQDLRNLRNLMINELNNVLKGKVILKTYTKISSVYWRDDIERISYKTQLSGHKNYEYKITIRKMLNKIYNINKNLDDFIFFIQLLNSDFTDILVGYRVSKKIKENDLIAIRNQLNEDDILVFLDDSLKMQYNINTGTNYTPNFKDNTEISMGQNAVALLLLILNAAYNLNDNRPLLMDQPEDDLDNSYIYSTLVKEFRNSKQKRQVIISTHNPNIPVAADAENILVLKYNGTYSTLSNTGGIDSKSIANDVLEIMEGGKEAIKRRTDKYNARYITS